MCCVHGATIVQERFAFAAPSIVPLSFLGRESDSFDRFSCMDEKKEPSNEHGYRQAVYPGNVGVSLHPKRQGNEEGECDECEMHGIANSHRDMPLFMEQRAVVSDPRA